MIGVPTRGKNRERLGHCVSVDTGKNAQYWPHAKPSRLLAWDSRVLWRSRRRVANIIETMTYMCYRYINRGLYEKDKLTFVLLVTMKILITAVLLKASDLTIFLRGGAALDINSVNMRVL